MLNNATVSQECYAWVQQINPKKQLNWESFYNIGFSTLVAECEFHVHICAVFFFMQKTSKGIKNKYRKEYTVCTIPIFMLIVSIAGKKKW